MPKVREVVGSHASFASSLGVSINSRNSRRDVARGRYQGGADWETWDATGRTIHRGAALAPAASALTHATYLILAVATYERG